MTYMYPSYYKLLDFDQERTPLAGKYGLMLYKHNHAGEPPLTWDNRLLTQVGEYDYTVAKSAKMRLRGIPALFIPGNAGSARQVRSVATEAWRYFYETAPAMHDGSREPWSKPIDFFTVDLNEEFSAFHGQLLLDQARYVNEAIAYILSLYKDNPEAGSDFPLPSSVLIIGHSMGGIVARSLFTVDNYLPGSVNTILTLATPHMIPPLAIDYAVTELYNKIEEFWRQGFEGPHSALANVSLVSILGGNQDITVNSDSGNIHHLVPQSHGFAVFTTSIPDAWVGSDHLSILWCNQVVKAIAEALVQVVDARNQDQVKPLGERMKRFRGRLLTGASEGHLHGTSPSRTNEEETISLMGVGHSFEETPANIWALPPKPKSSGASGSHLYITKVPKERSDLDTFSLLMSCQPGTPNCGLDILLCNDGTSRDSENDNPTSITFSCQRNSIGLVPVPASTRSSTMPLYESGDRSTGQEFWYGSKRSSDFDGIQYVVIEDRRSTSGQKVKGKFLITEFKNEASTVETVETTFVDLLWNGLSRSKFPSKPSLVSTLRLPNVDNSLLAYSIIVEEPKCQGSRQGRFAPMMKQSSWTMNEDKYAVNLAAPSSRIDINFHGDLPYFERVFLRPDENKGIDLKFWTDPTCSGQLSFRLTVDIYGSLGKVLIRYRTAFLVFTYMVIVLALRAQIQGWGEHGVVRPFGTVLSQLSRTKFVKFSGLLAVFSLLQSLFNSSAMVFFGSLPAAGWFNDALLGRNDMFFWFLSPIFFQVSIGIVAFVWFLLNSIVRFVAVLVGMVRREGSELQDQRGHGGKVAIAVMCILVATVLPYQFAFTATVVALIVVNARALSSSSSHAAWNQFHFAMTILVAFFFLLPFCVPALMVWIRNGAVGWWRSFDTDHRVDYVAPFMILVEGLGRGGALTEALWKRYGRITVLLLDGMLACLVVVGVRSSWQVYFLTRLWAIWLVVVRVLEVQILGARRRTGQEHDKQA
ncbi:GPI inositol deacylase [Dissophora globulifera]|nr:GPI inositol deacylase [Dissophora globulifera]